jgi:hypothetical protein
MSTPITPTIKGQSAYWGIPAGSYGAGIVTRITRDLDGEVAFLYDGNGYTISEILFDDKETFTVEMAMDATNFTLASLPTRGTVVTIVSVASCIVQKRGLAYEQKGWQTANFTAMSFVNLQLGS